MKTCLSQSEFFFVKIFRLELGDSLSIHVAFNMAFAMSFITGIFVVFCIKERVSRAKLLQFMVGANKFVFWMTAFIIDFLLMVVVALIYVLILGLYQKSGMSSNEELLRNFLVTIVFSFAVIPYVYLMSFLFNNPSVGLVRSMFIFIVSGNFGIMLNTVLTHDLVDLKQLGSIIDWILKFLPHYSFARSLEVLNRKQITMRTCERACLIDAECVDLGIDTMCELADELSCDNPEEPMEKLFCELKNSCCTKSFLSFEEDGIGWNLLVMMSVGVFFFLLLFSVEYRYIQRLSLFFSKKKR